MEKNQTTNLDTIALVGLFTTTGDKMPVTKQINALLYGAYTSLRVLEIANLTTQDLYNILMQGGIPPSKASTFHNVVSTLMFSRRPELYVGLYDLVVKSYSPIEVTKIMDVGSYATKENSK